MSPDCPFTATTTTHYFLSLNPPLNPYNNPAAPATIHPAAPSTPAASVAAAARLVLVTVFVTVTTVVLLLLDATRDVTTAVAVEVT